MTWREEWSEMNWRERVASLVVHAIIFGLWAAIILYGISAFLDSPPIEQRITVLGAIVLVGLYGIWSVLKQILFVLQGIHRMIYVARSGDRAP